MIKIKRRFKRFRLDNEKDVAEYEDVLNDSLCTVTNRETQIEKVKTFSDEGKLAEVTEMSTYLVHWEERVL